MKSVDSLLYSRKLGDMVPLVYTSPTQEIARSGMILRVVVGSTVHGTGRPGEEDRDEMGVCIEPPETVIGGDRFEHYTYRTQPEGHCSGPGDLDLTVYSLRKFAALAAQGNPTVLLPLFVGGDYICYVNEFGWELRDRRSMFLSLQAGHRFKGYLQSQRNGLLGLRSGGTRNQGRADIRERYGFDTKFASHMVRLGIQGVELLTTGTITLPVPEPDRTWLTDLRAGLHTKEEALDRAADLDAQLTELLKTSALPERPDRAAIDAWLVSTHRRFWGWA